MAPHIPPPPLHIYTTTTTTTTAQSGPTGCRGGDRQGEDAVEGAGDAGPGCHGSGTECLCLPLQPAAADTAAAEPAEGCAQPGGGGQGAAAANDGADTQNQCSPQLLRTGFLLTHEKHATTLPEGVKY